MAVHVFTGSVEKVSNLELHILLLYSYTDSKNTIAYVKVTMFEHESQGLSLGYEYIWRSCGLVKDLYFWLV